MTTKRQPIAYPTARKPLVIEETASAAPTVAENPMPAALAETEGREAPGIPPSRIGKKAVTFYLPWEKWLALRTASLRTGRPTHELMTEATDWVLSQNPET
jgi:hypothetical protein